MDLCNEEIYRPSDDTYLLTNHLAKYLESVGSIERALEIGSGSGFISCFACRYIDYLVMTDIDFSAIDCSRRIMNICGCGSKIDLVICRSGECFRRESFDLVYTNPPYLPCNDDARVCGGSEGVEIAIEIVRNLREILKRGHDAFIVSSSLGDLKKLLRECVSQSFDTRVVEFVRKFFEVILLIRISRRGND